MDYTFFFVVYGDTLAIDRGRIFSLKHCLLKAFSMQNKILRETEFTLGQNMKNEVHESEEMPRPGPERN